MTKEDLREAYDICQYALMQQIKAVNDIDTKISIIGGFAAVVFVLAWGQLYPKVQIHLFIVGMVALMGAMAILFYAYKTRKWYFGMKPQAIREEIDDGKQMDDIYAQIIVNIAGVANSMPEKSQLDKGWYRLNIGRLSLKSILVNISVWVLLGAIILIGVSRLCFCVPQ